MQLTRMILAAGAVAVVSLGCATHSPMRMTNAVSVKGAPTTTYAAHANKVFITKLQMQDTTPCEQLGQIDVGITTYSSMNKVYQRLADRARQMGADAVVGVTTWRQPSGWAWIAPQGLGQAVRFKDKSAIDFAKLQGEWY